jgi:hypothetical protein
LIAAVEIPPEEIAMSQTYMVLPARRHSDIHVVTVPADFEPQEAFRHVTGIIAAVEETEPDYAWEDVAEALEANGFVPINAIVGPELDL